MRFLPAVLSLVLAAPFSTFAVEHGSIGGTVADPSGAVIPAATVVARNLDASSDQQTTTDEAGHYTFVALPGGLYELRIEQAGFRPFRRTGLEVTAGASLQVDIALVLKEQSAALVVSEAAVQVETANTQSGGAIAASKLASVPVNGRSYTDLLALQPGVVPASSEQPNAVVMSGCSKAPPSGDLNPGNLSVNGQRETTNGFTVNGSNTQEDFNMGAAIVPNLDSIQELRILTGNFDAEFGNFSGAQVLVTTKSGGNQIHGSAFEYMRNTALDARNFFSAERAIYDRQQFGGTVGGPVRKDRLFLFADYQGTRMTQGIDTGLIAVPSLANRSGDFSDVAGSLSGTVNGSYWANRLSDRLGYTVRPGEPYYTPGCVSASECVLPNAQIPRSAWTVPATQLLPYIPAPNRASNLFSTTSDHENLRDDKGALRADAGTRFGNLSAYYFADDYYLDNPYPTGQGGANVPGFNATSMGRAQLAAIGLTTTIGSSAINEFRAGYTRNANQIGRPSGGVGPSLASQGFTGIVPLAPSIEGIENVSFNDFTIGSDITGVDQANNTYQISDSYSRVSGRHMWKVGGSVHSDQINIAPDAIYNGSFLFQGTETGSDFADFLLGIASSYAQGDSKHFYLRNRYAGLYAQDSWQLRPNLTVNFGVRWDLLPPWREKYNQVQTLMAGEQSQVYPGAPEGLVFPGDPGIPATLAPTRYANFSPRIGLAYSPAAKTSIRAGYGVFYTAIEGLSAGIMSACPPYGYDYDSLAPPLFETPFVTAASGQDVGQRFPPQIPVYGASPQHPGTTVDWSRYLPITGMPSFFPGNVTPYSESYTVSVQREVARNTVATASYNGSQAHHLLVLISANPGNPALCAYLSDPANVMAGTPTCGPFGESGIYFTRSGHQINGTRGPFNADFAAVTYQKTIANSNFNSLALSLRHAGRNLEFLVGYTYGKSIDQSSSLAEAVNPLNPSLNRGISAFDLRHNFVASYDWHLPVAGLALSGVTRFSTGLPVTLYNNNDTSLLGTIPNGINNDGVDTPDYSPGNLQVHTDPRNGQAAFNTSLFSLPDLGHIGTASRRFFYGPGAANFDVALHKNVKLSESRALEFRIEAFNIFNHAQFYGAAAVNGNITSSSFGQVVSAAAPRQVQAAMRFSF
ncbi:MAG TPA: TonB-dependent receptor [Bryobacteraceae bacterium]|nr:TonB-dependent receptor [Bryobacteraceae bacterium]